MTLPGRHLEMMMKITLSSVMVDDQAKALQFHAEVLQLVPTS